MQPFSGATELVTSVALSRAPADRDWDTGKRKASRPPPSTANGYGHSDTTVKQQHRRHTLLLWEVLGG